MKVYKQLLLVASLVTIIFLLAAAARETLFVEWKGWQKAYRKLLLERAQNPAEREEARTFEIKLRQVVLPQLQVVDRCVSCHPGIEDPRMAGQPNPLGLHPGDHLKIHPPERFGCSPCHRGQGRAIVFAEAKAEGYHWDYPLLPKRFSEASCTACHDPRALIGRGGDKRARGEKIFMREGCQGCHKLEGRGGGVGPALDNEGRKMTAQLIMGNLRGPKNLGTWLEEHFDDPQRVVPGSKMPRLLINPQERETLTLYMLSLEERVLPPGYIPKDRYAFLYRRTQPVKLKADGATLFGVFCSACHGKEGRGRHVAELETTLPVLTGTDILAVASDGYLHETITRGRRGRPMPGWRQEGGLNEEEVRALVSYLRKHEKKPLTHQSLMSAPANPSLGAELYRRRCSICHEAQDAPAIAPNLFRPNLRKHGGMHLIHQTLMHGRPDTAMGSFRDLTPAEVRGLTAFLLSAPVVVTGTYAPLPSGVKEGVQEGKTIYEKTCASCHGTRGEGGRGPALAGKTFQAAASDQFLLAESKDCAEREKLGPVSAAELVKAIRTLGREAPARLKGTIGGDAAEGAVLYTSKCSGCHGKKGEGGLGPALANPDFLNAATDGFLAASIVRGRGGTSMRAFGLQSFGFSVLGGAEVRNLVAYLRSWQTVKSTTEVKR